MSESVEDRTRKIVAEVFGVPLEQVTAQSSHETVEGWDSLNILNVLMAVESEFGISVSPEETASFVSVEKITAVVNSKGVS